MQLIIYVKTTTNKRLLISEHRGNNILIYFQAFLFIN
jgi:hypothetical protein